MQKFVLLDDVLEQISRSRAIQEEHFFSLGLDDPEDVPPYLQSATDQLHFVEVRMRKLTVHEMESAL